MTKYMCTVYTVHCTVFSLFIFLSAWYTRGWDAGWRIRAEIKRIPDPDHYTDPDPDLEGFEPGSLD